MNEQQLTVVIGALLHDIGKVVYRRGGGSGTHSEQGYHYLKDDIHLKNRGILECVRYHHAAALKDADIPADSPAYIVYLADNIASAADRREADLPDGGFDIHTPLQPVFNILNGNHGRLYYEPAVLDIAQGINYPTKEKKPFSDAQYKKITANITDNLRGLEWTEAYVNSLLEVLEANLSYVPSSTSKNEVPDISLYDHMKLTAAAASCIAQYLAEKGISNYRSVLFKNGKDFYAEEAFLLASLDISGIQKFIYAISTDENALRMLRARSFYLEIMMEHIIDLLLERLSLTRANLLYSGGGHCYLILANTEETRRTFDAFLKEINAWFLDTFDTDLYIAGGFEKCSGRTLWNEPEGSYAQLFRAVSAALSRGKSHRYSAEQIIALNRREAEDYTRECSICRRIGHLDADGHCPICRKMKTLSANVLYADFFAVSRGTDGPGLPLPGGYSLTAESEGSLREKIRKDPDFVRAYGKNKAFTGSHIATKLWVGSYTTGETFEEFARGAEGIKRIGVLRADVDNLGHAFAFGFADPANHNRYVTLSRTAALSRQLSLFFKGYIGDVLAHPEMHIGKAGEGGRKAAIVYSGGDDVFIVGAWDDIIGAAVDLRRCLARFTENTLTISAGIGIYHSKYPIRAIAAEVADMEDASKHLPGKNAVTLLEDGETHTVPMKAGNAGAAGSVWLTQSGKILRAGAAAEEAEVSDGTYSWQEFEERVVEEKLAVLAKFFAETPERGHSFLYRLLELIRGSGEKINFARFIYLLARLEPDEHAAPEHREAYRAFAKKMVEWYPDARDRRELKTAITLYAYLTRDKEDET